MVEIIEGNLLDATEDIIAQQVNCQGMMGSGLAKQIRAKHPEIYKRYTDYCGDKVPYELLGELNIVAVTGGKYTYVANIFGQLNYGRQNVLYTDYAALELGLRKLKHDAKSNRLTVAIPYNLGCGLANGDWDNVVYPMIKEVFKDSSVTIYKYEG
ncbi:macro domain-containing protein [Bacillus thuringiensis]|uniref:macro domain-containing protein n=1 Tax=Bacillus thuringiensis TaxID=1428 RepID=UPI0026E36F57|nr:macro domain-containing protein [Bacillus thuringiensis]MDO6628755.1 macro domain-containing protein [Bacillus thuringiensis]MDO6659324.1 macro domain-containing protein [Bacillus thuringiensis]MDO6698906.1 macro domain-containing protein [Bacillus thuringiensis]